VREVGLDVSWIGIPPDGCPYIHVTNNAVICQTNWGQSAGRTAWTNSASVGTYIYRPFAHADVLEWLSDTLISN